MGFDPHTLYLSYMVTTGLIKGQIYAFRYRAINAIGAGEWSEAAKLRAAAIPIAPPRPVYLSSTDTTITVGLLETTDNGGSLISSYKLYRDDGDLSSQVNIEVSYDGVSSEATATGLTAGKKYRFRHVATNEFGDSPQSLTLTVAASALPDEPTNIVIDWTKSSKTSLFVKWSSPATTPSSAIEGYMLEMDDG